MCSLPEFDIRHDLLLICECSHADEEGEEVGDKDRQEAYVAVLHDGHARIKYKEKTREAV